MAEEEYKFAVEPVVKLTYEAVKVFPDGSTQQDLSFHHFAAARQYVKLRNEGLTLEVAYDRTQHLGIG